MKMAEALEAIVDQVCEAFKTKKALPAKIAIEKGETPKNLFA